MRLGWATRNSDLATPQVTLPRSAQFRCAKNFVPASDEGLPSGYRRSSRHWRSCNYKHVRGEWTTRHWRRPSLGRCPPLGCPDVIPQPVVGRSSASPLTGGSTNSVPTTSWLSIGVGCGKAGRQRVSLDPGPAAESLPGTAGLLRRSVIPTDARAAATDSQEDSLGSDRSGEPSPRKAVQALRRSRPARSRLPTITRATKPTPRRPTRRSRPRISATRTS